MKKKSHPTICPLCACSQSRTLSTGAAVQIHEFLELLSDNFMAVYGRDIYRHYGKRTKRNINAREPWKGDCTGELF